MAPRANWKGFLRLSLVTCQSRSIRPPPRARRSHVRRNNRGRPLPGAIRNAGRHSLGKLPRNARRGRVRHAAGQGLRRQSQIQPEERRRWHPHQPPGLRKILENKEYAFGFDAQTGEYGNLFAKGIIDPTKVVRSALQDAASIAALLITTETMVADAPKKTDGAAHGAMPRALLRWRSFFSCRRRASSIAACALPTALSRLLRSLARAAVIPARLGVSPPLLLLELLCRLAGFLVADFGRRSLLRLSPPSRAADGALPQPSSAATRNARRSGPSIQQDALARRRASSSPGRPRRRPPSLSQHPDGTDCSGAPRPRASLSLMARRSQDRRTRARSDRS